MSKSRFRLLLIVVGIVLSTNVLSQFLVLGRDAAQQPTGKAQWTVMIYMAADNDLEKFALADVNEMEFVGSSDSVNVVLQIDRSAQFDTSSGDWTTTRRYYITEDLEDVAGREINAELIEDLGETNMGDSAVLSDFGTWAIGAYPAEHYALILWDHGGSWLGVAADGSVEGYDGLTLPELKTALATITEEAEIDTLDVVGFDACLMGSLEVYRSIQPYADYAVASPELVPGFGWSYTELLFTLIDTPTMDGEAFGRAAVDAFYNYYTATVRTYPIANLGLVDLSLVDGVVDGLAALADVVDEAGLETINAFASAREGTLVYGGNNDPRLSDVWSAADLRQFLEKFSALVEDAAIQAAAQALIAKLDAMTLYYRTTTPDAGDSGVSIFFPRNSAIYLTGEFASRYASEAPDGFGSWQTVLTTYYDEAVGIAQDNPVLEVVGSGLLNEFQISLAGLGVNRAAFTVVYSQPGAGEIVVEYQTIPLDSAGDRIESQQETCGRRISFIADGVVEIPVLVIENQDRTQTGIVNGQYLAPDGEVLEAQAFFTLSAGGGGVATSFWAVRQTLIGPMPFEIAIEAGARFQPYWVQFDAQNDFVVAPAGDVLTFGAAPFTLEKPVAPFGSYEVRVIVENTAGQRVVQSARTNLRDRDEDCVPDERDNCAFVPNADQSDANFDGLGSACQLPSAELPPVVSSPPASTPQPGVPAVPTEILSNPVPGVPELTQVSTPTPPLDIVLSPSVGAATTPNDGQVTYTLVLVNNGDRPLEFASVDVQLTNIQDPFVEGTFQFISGGADSGEVAVNGGSLFWNVPPLGPGQSVSLNAVIEYAGVGPGASADIVAQVFSFPADSTPGAATVQLVTPQPLP